MIYFLCALSLIFFGMLLLFIFVRLGNHLLEPSFFGLNKKTFFIFFANSLFVLLKMSFVPAAFFTLIYFNIGAFLGTALAEKK